jgi:hypothetical protein
MKVSNFIVNFAMRSRSSSNPKLMLGSVSAIDGASAELRGGRIALVDRDGSKTVDMIAIDRISAKMDCMVYCDNLLWMCLNSMDA